MTDDYPRPSLQAASPSNSSCKTTPGLSKACCSQHIIEISDPEPKWQDCSSLDYKALIKQCLEAVLKQVMKKNTLFELSVLLTNDTEIQALNKEYRQKEGATNILSFESGCFSDHNAPLKQGRPIPIGDLVLSYETLKKEAESQHKSFQDHLTHLLIHGLLHLFGFDHEDEREADEMERLEINILDKEFHIKNPYIVRG